MWPGTFHPTAAIPNKPNRDFDLIVFVVHISRAFRALPDIILLSAVRPLLRCATSMSF